MRAGSCHARDRVQRMDAPMQLLSGLSGARSLGPYIGSARAGMAESARTPPFLLGLRCRVKTSSSCKNIYGARVVTALLHSTV
jgi:hypothetical protein